MSATERTPLIGPPARPRLRHMDHPLAVQHIVFRVADALPRIRLDELAIPPNAERIALAERDLDAGLGSCALSDPTAARIVAMALQRFDGERYHLRAWCVMPTHVHVLADQAEGWPLAAVVHSWKSFTAHRIGRTPSLGGRFWAPNYFDRYMRDDDQLNAARVYIEANPVSAGLCDTASDWPWSSAGRR